MSSVYTHLIITLLLITLVTLVCIYIYIYMCLGLLRIKQQLLPLAVTLLTKALQLKTSLHQTYNPSSSSSLSSSSLTGHSHLDSPNSPNNPNSPLSSLGPGGVHHTTSNINKSNISRMNTHTLHANRHASSHSHILRSNDLFNRAATLHQLAVAAICEGRLNDASKHHPATPNIE